MLEIKVNESYSRRLLPDITDVLVLSLNLARQCLVNYHGLNHGVIVGMSGRFSFFLDNYKFGWIRVWNLYLIVSRYKSYLWLCNVTRWGSNHGNKTGSANILIFRFQMQTQCSCLKQTELISVDTENVCKSYLLNH